MTDLKRAFTIILCLGLLAAACSDSEPSAQSPAAAASSEVSPSRVHTTSSEATPSPQTRTPDIPPTGTATVEVWFAVGPPTEPLGPFLFEAHRAIPQTSTPGSAAMEALLQGPTAKEERADLGTAIPAGTHLLGLSIKGGTASVELSDEFESGGGTTSVLMRLAQVVYTLTQFPTVDRVLFMADGKPIKTFSTEGVMLNGRPQTRDDYANQLPPTG